MHIPPLADRMETDVVVIEPAEASSKPRRASSLGPEHVTPFLAAFDLGSIGMMIMDLDGRIIRVNAALCRLLDRSEDELVGTIAADWTHESEATGENDQPSARDLVEEADSVDLERRYERPNGEVVSALVHLTAVRDQAGEPEYMLAQLVDITDRKRVEEEMERLAMHDALTGLPNRYLLQDRLETALARCERSNRMIAVLFIDVDHFKLVNDSLGHATGDTLLLELAQRLRGETRPGDTVARFGGDEFVMVCEDVVDTEEAQRIGARISRMFEEAFMVGEQQLYVTVSTGIVLADASATPVTVLRDADAAMYKAKEGGRSRFELFHETLRHKAAKRLGIEMTLPRALERDELRLVFQPIVSLPSDLAVGVEALVRWDHPERGTLLPTEFIPAAEQSGLIVPIGAWVLERALRQLAVWQMQLPGADSLYVAVNLSPRQLLGSDILSSCRESLHHHRVPPSSLCLELTEGAVMADVEVSIPILKSLADSGIRLAVDDFGAGYSSLSYLKRLPVQMLKIDRSFVDGLGRDPDDSSIVRAIVSLGHTLNLQVCAEGVETTEQRAELVGLACPNAQGYLWSPPMRPEHFSEWYLRRLAEQQPAKGYLRTRTKQPEHFSEWYRRRAGQPS